MYFSVNPEQFLAFFNTAFSFSIIDFVPFLFIASFLHLYCLELFSIEIKALRALGRMKQGTLSVLEVVMFELILGG